MIHLLDHPATSLQLREMLAIYPSMIKIGQDIRRQVAAIAYELMGAAR